MPVLDADGQPSRVRHRLPILARQHGHRQRVVAALRLLPGSDRLARQLQQSVCRQRRSRHHPLGRPGPGRTTTTTGLDRTAFGLSEGEFHPGMPGQVPGQLFQRQHQHVLSPALEHRVRGGLALLRLDGLGSVATAASARRQQLQCLLAR